MKLFLLILCNFFITALAAQNSDFLLLKKKSKTIATYFPGSAIRFTTITGASIDAKISIIKNDTLFLKQYVIRQIPTQLGVYILDTSTYYYQYHYNQIKAINQTGRHFDWQASGGVLMGGGLLLTVASGVVYLADNKRFSPGLMAASAGLFGVGYLLSRNSGKGMVIGKKYKLDYIGTKAGTK
ncbi:MAG: hypothetical protein QM791_19220 [Ferruginibacter sp.]